MTETAERCRCGTTGRLYDSTAGRVCIDCYLAAVEAGNGWTVVKPEKSKKSRTSCSSSTADVSGSTDVPHSLPSGVGIGIGTSSPPRDNPKSGSKRFAALEKDAQKFDPAPVAMHLPDDLSPVQLPVVKDYAYVAGIYVVHNGRAAVLAEGVPYSKRWRMEVLGLSDITIHRALQALERRGLLKDCGETEPDSGYPRGTKLYAPGARFLV